MGESVAFKFGCDKGALAVRHGIKDTRSRLLIFSAWEGIIINMSAVIGQGRVNGAAAFSNLHDAPCAGARWLIALRRLVRVWGLCTQ